MDATATCADCGPRQHCIPRRSKPVKRHLDVAPHAAEAGECWHAGVTKSLQLEADSVTFGEVPRQYPHCAVGHRVRFRSARGNLGAFARRPKTPEAIQTHSGAQRYAISPFLQVVTVPARMPRPRSSMSPPNPPRTPLAPRGRQVQPGSGGSQPPGSASRDSTVHSVWRRSTIQAIRAETSRPPTHTLSDRARCQYGVNCSRRHTGRCVAGVHPSNTCARVTAHQLGRRMRQASLSLGSVRPARTVWQKCEQCRSRQTIGDTSRALAEPAVETVSRSHHTLVDAGGPRCAIGYGPSTLKSAI